jgi:hypothetical protein
MKKHKEALKCLEEGFKRAKNDWKICENLMYVALDCMDISKLIFAVTNLYLLEKHERIKPNIYYSLIKLYITGYPQYSDHSKKYYKDRIYDIFQRFTEKDGLTFEVWDLYIYLIQSVEIELNKITVEKDLQSIYEKQLDLRLKQARILLIPEWEKDEKVIDKMKEVIKKIKEEIVRNKEENFVKEVKTFVESIEGKIERYYKTKELDKILLNK